MDIVYNGIGRVLFQRNNIDKDFVYIKEFEDSYNTITIKTEIEIDFIERGWLGDITYWATGGWELRNELNNCTSEPVFIKDALCIRVEVRPEVDCPVTWTYTFLKY